MNTHTDPILACIIAQGRHPDIPPPVAAGAHWLAHLLLAARSWSTIGGFTGVRRLKSGRFAAPVDERWVLSFAWDYDCNRALAMKLERYDDDEGSKAID